MYTERDLKAAFRAGETNERNEAYDESGKGFDHWFEFEFAIAPAEKERLFNQLLVEAKKVMNGEGSSTIMKIIAEIEYAYSTKRSPQNSQTLGESTPSQSS